MKNKIFIFGIITFLVLGGLFLMPNLESKKSNIVEARSIGTYADFYYSESCSHCRAVFPLVKELSEKYPINFLNVDKGSYNIEGVPTAIIKTSDGRKITLIGSEEIPKYLKCELQEMSTMECPTGLFNEERQSWFIRE